MSIAVVISTSSSEACFLPVILRECKKFATHIAVSFGSARFDGTPEKDFITDVIKTGEHTDVQFVQYEVTPTIEVNPLKNRPSAFWHNVSRLAGISAIPHEAEWVFFLDGDEIPNGEDVKLWLDNTTLHDTCSYKLANYWYFRDVTFRAQQWEDSVLLVPRRAFAQEDTTYAMMMQDDERDALARYFDCKRMVLHPYTNKPMFHHFSWVRSKKDILAKVKHWGHKDDRPWEQYIHDAWSKPFDGTDFVHGYDYDTVENVFGISLVEILDDAL